MKRELKIDILDYLHNLANLYDEDKADGVMLTLLAMAEHVPPGASGKWKRIFRELGRMHAHTGRFDLILGIYLALPHFLAQEWLPAWIQAMPSAKIHPISLLLCLRPEDEPFNGMIDGHLRELNAKHKWFEGWEEHFDRKSEFYPRWTLNLRPGRAADNVLSSDSMEVVDTISSKGLQIGEGWCVNILHCATGGHWFGCRIGRDLTVIRCLCLMQVVGPISVKTTVQVAGICLPQRLLRGGVDMPLPDGIRKDIGIRIQGKTGDYEGVTGCRAWDGLEHCLTIPESYVALVAHLEECRWMQPKQG